MSNEPEVSLVMVAGETPREWLLAAVASALGQRGCDLELVLVDDGCAPPLKEVLDSITEDERLVVMRTDHLGPYAARNAGTAAAHGRYLRFLDADDVFELDSTARLLALAGGRDDVIPYGATSVCDASLVPTGSLSSALTGDATRACLLGHFRVMHFSMLFPRRIIEAAGAWDPSFKIMGDWDFVLRALEHGRVVPDSSVASFYRVHPGSFQSRSGVETAEAAWRRIGERYFARHPELRGTALERKARASCAANYARTYARAGRVGPSLNRLCRAAVLSPREGGAAAAWLVRRRARTLLSRTSR